ncbi:hypothetical protein GTY86_12710 [Streptomyces sp. SID5770]|nr:hypothetical protein [Streptomyces sp. SID5770]
MLLEFSFGARRRKVRYEIGRHLKKPTCDPVDVQSQGLSLFEEPEK